MLNRFGRLFSNKRLAAAVCGNADQLRDARLWGPAAQLYKSYLELRPRDAAIWVQFGHCQKESGLLDEADVSYGRAAAIAPNGGDIWLQIGHLRKVQGRISEAAVNYAKALTKEPALMPARFELEGLGFAPSDIASLIAGSGSPAAMARFREFSERPADRPSQTEERLIEPNSMLDAPGPSIKEVRARLDEVQERISTQSRHIDRLLELMSTVKALGFAVKRQEGQAAEAAGRLVAVETKLDRLDHLLRDMPALAGPVADCPGRGDFTATDRQVSELPSRLGSRNFRMLQSSVCRYEEFLAPWYREWAVRLGLPLVSAEAEEAGLIVHRKHWEYCAIAQALYERGMLGPSRTGCGFAVGREPLASAFASMGVQVLATDQASEGAAELWIATEQHAQGLENVYMPGLISRTDFDARVRFRPADMRDLRLPWSETFDFIWSSCAVEHLGSLEAGWQFVLSSMDLVKPGGMAVHTIEFNVASDDETLTDGASVIYRRRDIEDLDRQLRAIACGLSKCDFFAGDDQHDIDFDYPPYFNTNRPHVKLLLHGHVATSFLLIIRKGIKGDGITIRDIPAALEVAPQSAS